MKFENIRNLREDNDKTQKEVAAYGLGDVKEDYPTIHSFSELKNILRELD